MDLFPIDICIGIVSEIMDDVEHFVDIENNEVAAQERNEVDINNKKDSDSEDVIIEMMDTSMVHFNISFSNISQYAFKRRKLIIFLFFRRLIFQSFNFNVFINYV